MENRAKVGCTVYLLRFILVLFLLLFIQHREQRKSEVRKREGERDQKGQGLKLRSPESALTGYTTFGVREVPLISFVRTKIAWTFYFKSYRFKKT